MLLCGALLALKPLSNCRLPRLLAIAHARMALPDDLRAAPQDDDKWYDGLLAGFTFSSASKAAASAPGAVSTE